MNDKAQRTIPYNNGLLIPKVPAYERPEYVVRTKLGALLIHLRLKQIDFAKYCKIPIPRLNAYISKDVCPSASTWLKMKRAIKEAINYDMTDDVIDENVSLEQYVKSLKLFIVTEMDEFIAKEKEGAWKIDDGKKEPTLHLIISPDPPQRKPLLAGAMKEVNQGKYRENRKDAVKLLEGYKVEEHYTEIDGSDVLTPIQALRKVLNLSRTIMAYELKVSTNYLKELEAGVLVMNVPLAKAMQEFSWRRGFPVTLDELYQNIKPYTGVESEAKKESDR